MVLVILKTNKIMDFLGVTSVGKKESKLKGVLKEMGYESPKEKPMSFEENQISIINQFVSYSISNLNNSHYEAVHCDYLDLLDFILFDLQERKRR